jgi:hypothetical protein
MDDGNKIKGWDQPVTIHSRLAREVDLSQLVIHPTRQGCFRFDDGTTQGWTLDQIYDTNTQAKVTPFTHPTTGETFDFKLGNSQNLALCACCNPLVILTPNISMVDIYMESPDLSLLEIWQAAGGYSLDVYRTLTSPCGEPSPTAYYAQMQAWLVDQSDQSLHLYAEWNQGFVFHDIKLLTNYHLIFQSPQLAQGTFKLSKIRIRLTAPNPVGFGAGECAIRGKWLIGNICPE